MRLHSTFHSSRESARGARGPNPPINESNSGPGKTAIIDLRQVQINEKLAETGGSSAGIFSCYIDGWNCVMKELDMGGAGETAIEHFEAEIRLLEELPRHPNISRYLHHHRKGDKLRLYITRYACSLYDYVSNYRAMVEANRQEPFTPSQICRFSDHIVKGISFLHQHNIIHRDLKSDNIFVKYDEHREIGSLVIGDFDTAKRITQNVKAKTVIGTISFMAPEVMSSDGKSGYGFAVDIWSFGMILFELLTLHLPYQNDSAMEIADLLQYGQRPKFPNLVQHGTEYDGLIDLFEDCTYLDPEKRPNIQGVKKSLRKIQKEFHA